MRLQISQNATRQSMSISWKHEYQTSCFQSHNSHKGVLKMPLEMAVLSIS